MVVKNNTLIFVLTKRYKIMGQYYKPVVLAPKKDGILEMVIAWVYSHEVKNRYKGHNGKYFTSGNGLKLMEHSWLGNKFVKCFESLIKDNPQRIVWGGDYAESEKEMNAQGEKVNLYNLCEDGNKVLPKPAKGENRYIINHTKETFVDKRKVPANDGWRIHPLSLLTCEGNGQGGGDYFAKDEHGIIGSWARDVISVSNKKPKGFTELTFDLMEK